MKALVTGGAGFIGSNIVESLLEQGAEVTVLDDLSSGHKKNISDLITAKHVRFVQGDVRDASAVRDAMQGADTVFHLAASVGNKRSIDHPEIDSDINVSGTLRVLEAARDLGVEKVVSSSSAGIYGELKTIPIDESHPIEPLTPYGVSKLYTEKQTLAFAHTYGFEAICLRYFNVYGPNQRFDAYGNVIPIFVFRALQQLPIIIFGDGKQTRDFVHVADVVQANIAAAKNRGVSGAFNIASGTQIEILDLAKRINQCLPEPVAIEFGPTRMGDVLHSLANVQAAQASFGFNPVKRIDTGLPEYVAWAQKDFENSKG
ncbi:MULTISPECIES: SDR family NAD(P)-dependent oxidoreductase [Idiomarina]|uniref:SDR family NAD(P)-dependent oxidoreductase n=1 Tax=Idiomarina TaxID=135575 RepID=UPI001389AB31|nr:MULTISPECIES: SDR family NAD(P)-dependent oxidoreductase [Idiomarina]MRJ42533.1 SDR family NAD(P)-dependent oxidoreductase [Idiomarina sp. FeN1]NCU58146.1 SDR family NAD(P)-dependent oxidoreductase [Idiomarina sp. FenA--70]NCU60844.1 SDR family NAD(P)-dependent oxidoreductase [Idiomarina sp. FenBw--71]UUN12742.1 SDR family NAD(P)-dependent oxidoreductase [Idiomarina loihiensis]